LNKSIAPSTFPYVHSLRRLSLLLAFILSLLGPAPYARATPVSLRVAVGGSTSDPTCGGNVDWSNPCDLYYALTSRAVLGDELWVRAGTYFPATRDPDTRQATFTLKSDVGLYGGFAGTETSRSQRNPAANVTILSGDIDHNDTSSIVGMNSYHVVTGSLADATAVLDGFTITAGYALINNVFPKNVGGGLLNDGGSPTVNNVTFNGNWASGNGGGMYNHNGSPQVANTIFSNNVATNGGGIYNDASSPRLTNLTFSGNGAYGNGGAIYNLSASPHLTNVTIYNNTAGVNGGGIYNDASSPTLAFVTFSGNTVYGNGWTIYNLNNSQPVIRNSLVWDTLWNPAISNLIYNASGSTATATYSDINMGTGAVYPGVGNLNSDPRLSLVNYTGGSVHALLAGSPAIDAVPTAQCTAADGSALATDQRGASRPHGPGCDMGAFELNAVLGILSGDGQSTDILSAFASLGVSLTSPSGDSLVHTLVTFSAPASGASAIFGSGNPATVMVASNGQAWILPYANDQLGSYIVRASAPGADPVEFHLTNGIVTPTFSATPTATPTRTATPTQTGTSTNHYQVYLPLTIKEAVGP
jgi:hypothetical protein